MIAHHRLHNIAARRQQSPKRRPAIKRSLFTIPEDKSCNSFPCAGDEALAHKERSCYLIKMERRSRGLAPLTQSPYLEQLAQIQVDSMVQQQYVSHSVANVDELKRFLHSDRVGENVQRGSSVESMHVDTMSRYKINRSNVLSPSYNQFGMAVAKGADGLLYLCQLFRFSPSAEQR